MRICHQSSQRKLFKFAEHCKPRRKDYWSFYKWSVPQNVFTMVLSISNFPSKQRLISKHLQLSLAMAPATFHMVRQTSLHHRSSRVVCHAFCMSLHSSQCGCLYISGSCHALALYQIVFLKSQLPNSILYVRSGCKYQYP